MSSKILFLEDDALFGETIVDLLEEDGHSVVYTTSSSEVLELTFKQKFDLYLFDINVPLMNGLELLHSLRNADDKTPAIFLTSHKEQEVIQEGFLSGGDDYVKKPFDSFELLLRIQALLKRTQGDSLFRVGPLANDKKRKRIFFHENELELSQKEYALLALLMENANKVVTKEMIIDELWRSSEDIGEGAIRVYINRIKNFLDESMIENVRGVGYKLVL
jgi:DNA-binding response OmpR family regulator